MPLTEFQKAISRIVAKNRTPDSYLAGGAALHFAPNSQRYSNDLDFFHDSEERVAEAFKADQKSLESAGIGVEPKIEQPGFIRAIASRGAAGSGAHPARGTARIYPRGAESTKIEWAHDSSWRFLPTIAVPDSGYQLHPLDLALNKLLALAGRDEARDFLDVLYIHDAILPLGALCWAASSKDPGFTPLSLLELLKRKGRYQPADFERLNLSAPVDLKALKAKWLDALGQAETFIRSRPMDEAGCLYYSPGERRFVAPQKSDPPDRAVAHYGRPGGIVPNLYTGDFLADQLRSLRLD